MMTNSFVLPEDLQIVSLRELPPEVRTNLEGDDLDYAVTRPKSRIPSKVIDSSAADLLREFKAPSTLVEAILRFSKARHLRPTNVLEEAYPFLEDCLISKLLVEPGTQSEAIRASLQKGAAVGEYVIEDTIQVLADTELYRVRGERGAAALKISRVGAEEQVRGSLNREARILARLGGRIAPTLFASGNLEDGRVYLIMEWIPGETSGGAAAALRADDGERPPEALLRMCNSILNAYAELHDLGVIHSDVHVNNVIVGPDGTVRIVDYGIARSEMSDPQDSTAHRGGFPLFYEPEYAKALLAGTIPPQSSRSGEQYAVAALVYLLLCGRPYADFEFGREQVLRQIIEESPVALRARGLTASDPLDQVLQQALSKEPSSRFSSVAEFAAASLSAALRLNGSDSKGSSLGNDECCSSRGAGKAETISDWVDSLLARLSKVGEELPVCGVRFPTVSVTYGAAGIAYGLLRIAGARQDAQIFDLADRWMNRAALEVDKEDAFYHTDVQILPETVGTTSPYHTRSGVAFVQAKLAQARGDQNNFARATEQFMRSSSGDCENPDLTLGRSGTLLALAELLEPLPLGLEGGQQQVVEFGNGLLGALWKQLQSEPPIAQSDPSTYLGIAHGWAGYLFATLRWARASGSPLPVDFDCRLSQLKGEAKWSGRSAFWPYQKRPGAGFVGGWCNGSAGFAFLWALAHRELHDPEMLALAEAAASSAATSPPEGHSICCGLSGKAYSQLSVFKSTRDSKWLDTAMQLTLHAIQNARLVAKRGDQQIPMSLYKGDVGLAVLAAEIEDPEFAAMPIFEEEGWPR